MVRRAPCVTLSTIIATTAAVAAADMSDAVTRCRRHRSPPLSSLLRPYCRMSVPGIRCRHAFAFTVRGVQVKALRKEVRARESKVVREVLRSRDVVLATCVGAATYSLKDEEFDLVVIDEAAQVSGAWGRCVCYCAAVLSAALAGAVIAAIAAVVLCKGARREMSCSCSVISRLL